MKTLINAALSAVNSKTVKAGILFGGLVLSAGIVNAQTQFSQMWKTGAVGVSFTEVLSSYSYGSENDFRRLHNAIRYEGKGRVNELYGQDGFLPTAISTSPEMYIFSVNKQLGKPGSHTVGTIGMNFSRSEQAMQFTNIVTEGTTSNYTSEYINIRFKELVDQVGVSYNQDLMLLKPESKFNVFVSGGLRGGVGLSSSMTVQGIYVNSKVNGSQVDSEIVNYNENVDGTNTNYYGANFGLGFKAKIYKGFFVRAMGQASSIRFSKPDANWSKGFGTVGFEAGIFYQPF